MTFHLPGEIVGGAIPGTQAQRNCTSVALESTRVSAIPYAVWREAIDSCRTCRDQFMHEIGAQAMHLETHLQVLGRPIALQRLALFLLETSKRFRTLQRDPMLLTLTMSRADLANYLGLAVETVCRLLGTLRRSGIIATDHRTIRLLDFEALEAVEVGSFTLGQRRSPRPAPVAPLPIETMVARSFRPPQSRFALVK